MYHSVCSNFFIRKSIKAMNQTSNDEDDEDQNSCRFTCNANRTIQENVHKKDTLTFIRNDSRQCAREEFTINIELEIVTLKQKLGNM